MTLRKKLFKTGLIGILALVGCNSRQIQTIPEIERKPLPLQPIKIQLAEKKLTWEEVENAEIKSPIDIFKYLAKIEYVEDKTEYWQSAKETIERGKGDCEDFAILGAYLARKLKDYNLMLLSLEGYNYNKGRVKKIQHMITLLKKETDSGVRYIAIDYPTCFVNAPSFERLEDSINKVYASYGTQIKNLTTLNLTKSEINWKTGEKNLFPAMTIEASEMFKRKQAEDN